MKMNRENAFRRTRRLTLLLAAGAALAAGALGYSHLDDFIFVYRFSGLLCLAPSAGSLLFLLINRTTGGQWSESLEPYLVSGARLTPWVWLCALPATWFHFATPAAKLPNGPVLRIYESTTGVIVRDFIYLAVFFALRWLCQSRATTSAESTPQSNSAMLSQGMTLRGDTSPWFGPVGLIVCVFTLHLLAVDWMAAIEPEWHSTSFPLVWMSGQAVAGLALAVLCSLCAGADPAANGLKNRPLGIDWGNLLLTAAVFWSYVGFMEFLIIWNGDLPREVGWYARRTSGSWSVVIVTVAVLHLLIPFFALLSRKLKQSRGPLAAVAALLLFAQLLYQGWLILPSRPLEQSGGRWLAATLTLGGLSLLLNRYLVSVEKNATDAR